MSVAPAPSQPQSVYAVSATKLAALLQTCVDLWLKQIGLDKVLFDVKCDCVVDDVDVTHATLGTSAFFAGQKFTVMAKVEVHNLKHTTPSNSFIASVAEGMVKQLCSYVQEHANEGVDAGWKIPIIIHPEQPEGKVSLVPPGVVIEPGAPGHPDLEVDENGDFKLVSPATPLGAKFQDLISAWAGEDPFSAQLKHATKTVQSAMGVPEETLNAKDFTLPDLQAAYEELVGKLQVSPPKAVDSLILQQQAYQLLEPVEKAVGAAVTAKYVEKGVLPSVMYGTEKQELHDEMAALFQYAVVRGLQQRGLSMEVFVGFVKVFRVPDFTVFRLAFEVTANNTTQAMGVYGRYGVDLREELCRLACDVVWGVEFEMKLGKFIAGS